MMRVVSLYLPVLSIASVSTLTLSHTHSSYNQTVYRTLPLSDIIHVVSDPPPPESLHLSRRSTDKFSLSNHRTAVWKVKTYPLTVLKGATLPAGVDPTRRELYLTEEEFGKLFGCKK